MAYYADETGRRKATEYGAWVGKIANGGGNLIPAATITNLVSTSGAYTVTANNMFATGMSVLLNGLTTTTALNGTTQTITGATATTFTFTTGSTTVSTHAETGTSAPNQSITLTSQYVELSDGTQFNPYNVNAPLLVGSGPNQETVTPTSVSINGFNQEVITAPYVNLHGQNDRVVSATFGLQEAINFCTASGGIVEIGSGFGGTNATITAAVQGSVFIEDVRGGTNAIAGVQMLTSAITSTVTTTTLPAGTLVATSNATGKGHLFYSTGAVFTLIA